ncbi:MAG: hypothetical protein CL610_14310 [Anaerolineaceae bacterium]|nr:hypothetical protein [Anaerolineaceae bacterium]
MREISRLIGTAFIWTMLAIILTSASVASSGDMTQLAVILGIGATISTGMIWNSGSGQKHDEANRVAEKAKRSSRVSRLMDNLDDDEVYQLEELLASRRDEQPLERH